MTQDNAQEYSGLLIKDYPVAHTGPIVEHRFDVYEHQSLRFSLIKGITDEALISLSSQNRPLEDPRAAMRKEGLEILRQLIDSGDYARFERGYIKEDITRA